MKIEYFKPALRLLIIVLFVSMGVWTADVPADESLFWRIESAGAVVYLLGSIHVADEDLYPFPFHIENAFNESDYLVVEVNIAEIDQQEIVRLIQTHGMYGDDTTLRAVVPDTVYEAVRAEFREYGLNILQFERMKPWVVAITLSQLQAVKFGYQPEHGVDMYFLSDAEGMEIIELESAAEQISIFSDLELDLQILLLKDFLYNLSMPRERIHELMDAYRNRDAEWIRNFVFESVDAHPELKPLYEKLLDERNAHMADTIASFLEREGTYFVVVGAGHLFGDIGIVALLGNKGYTVEAR
jgi:uncharacterized protein